MSIPRNTVPAGLSAATPAAGAAARVGNLRRRAVMVGNLVASSGLFFFAACSDSGITAPAPAAPVAERTVPIAAAPSNDPAARAVAVPGLGLVTRQRGDTTIEEFTYVPGEGLVVMSTRGHKVVMPAGAICDPATSGYGLKVFNTTCAPATSPIRFTMRSWVTRDSAAQLTFAPDVRFQPSKTVLLHIVRPRSSGLAGSASPILWCSADMTNCVNEALTDRSLGTSFDPFAHSAWRRIKHFSGFNTGFGRSRGQAGDNGD